MWVQAWLLHLQNTGVRDGETVKRRNNGTEGGEHEVPKPERIVNLRQLMFLTTVFSDPFNANGPQALVFLKTVRWGHPSEVP